MLSPKMVFLRMLGSHPRAPHPSPPRQLLVMPWKILPALASAWGGGQELLETPGDPKHLLSHPSSCPGRGTAYLDREGESHKAKAAEVHVDGVEDGPDEVVAGRRRGPDSDDGGRQVPFVGCHGQVVLPGVGRVHGHGERHPAALLLHQPGWGSGAGQPLYIALACSPALSSLYIKWRNYSPPRAVVIRNAWLGARRNKVGFVSLPFSHKWMGFLYPAFLPQRGAWDQGDRAVGWVGNQAATTPRTRCRMPGDISSHRCLHPRPVGGGGRENPSNTSKAWLLWEAGVSCVSAEAAVAGCVCVCLATRLSRQLFQ